MNPIQNALRQVHFVIPDEILRLVFRERRTGFVLRPRNIDEIIREKVIEARVLMDCNLVASQLVSIDISGLQFEKTELNTWVVRIPKDYTGGRSIMSVSGVSYQNPRTQLNQGYATALGGSMMNSMRMMLASDTPVPNYHSHRVDLVGENVIMIDDLTTLQPNMWLWCHIANDENMNNLRPKYYPPFADLVVFAVKAFVYNSHIVKMDVGELQGGMSLGRIKEIIEQYSDAEQMYQDYLRTKWPKKALLNDMNSHTRYINSLIAAGR